MTNFKTVFVVFILLLSISSFASTGKEVVNSLNNKLEVTIKGKLVTVKKDYGVKMYIFETATGEHVNTKTTNTIDFTQLKPGLYTIKVKGYTPTTFEIK